MFKKIKSFVLGSALLFGMAAVPALVGDVSYAANTAKVCEGLNSIQDPGTQACDPDAGGGELSAFIKRIINILLFIIGVIAVIMIIVGGIRYVTSAGDQSAVSGAKNTILYSIVGLVIAIMAFAIVNFFVTSIK